MVRGDGHEHRVGLHLLCDGVGTVVGVEELDQVKSRQVTSSHVKSAHLLEELEADGALAREHVPATSSGTRDGER
jgi:hypothetical protein